MFADNILGWYNQIAEFIIQIKSELMSPQWDSSVNTRYRLLLDKLRDSDKFYSNCCNSVEHLSHYEIDQPVGPELEKKLRQLIAEYRLFEESVFKMKDEIGHFLSEEERGFSDSSQPKKSSNERKIWADRIEQDFLKFQTCKNTLIRIIRK